MTRETEIVTVRKGARTRYRDYCDRHGYKMLNGLDKIMDEIEKAEGITA